MGNFKYQYFSESEITRRISFTKDFEFNYALFSNVVCDPFGIEDYHKNEGFLLGFEVDRSEIGLKTNRKPGDIDILIIPVREGKIYVSRACAIEVKVVRPTRRKPSKSPNSFGIKQVNGLVQDGFPIVGLIHICMTEPSNEDEKIDIRVIDENDHESLIHEFSSDIESNRSKSKRFDPFPSYASENQFKKLLSFDLPKYVGLKTISINTLQSGSLVAHYDFGLNTQFGSAYFNPHKKQETIQCLEKFIGNEMDSLLYAKCKS